MLKVFIDGKEVFPKESLAIVWTDEEEGDPPLQMKVTEEGFILDLFDPQGEVEGTAYQFTDDLRQLCLPS